MPQWIPSIAHTNLLQLGDQLQQFEAAACPELHLDFTDGASSPNLSLGFEMLEAVVSSTSLPCTVHLQAERPERFIDRCVSLGCKTLTVQVEGSVHIHRLLAQIRDAGASVGIAINPGTSLTKLEYSLPCVDRVLVRLSEPGDKRLKMVGSAVERVRILHENLQYNEQRAFIEIEGAADARQVAELAKFGARAFVVDDPAIIGGDDVIANIEALQRNVDAEAALLQS